MGSIRFATFLLLVPAAAAQSIVSPKHFANAEGPSFSSDGLGDGATPYRFLQLHDDLAGTPRTINRLSLRRDGTISTAIHPARTVVLDLFVSTGVTKAVAPNTSFDANHGANKVQLATFKQVRLPETGHGSMPRPFEYQVPFDQPFSYDGLGSLCWELKVQVRQNSTIIHHDWVTGSSTNPQMADTSTGNGCRSADHTTAMQLRASGSLNWISGGGSITYSGSSAPKNSFDYVTVGTSESSFLGVPLPLEFAPASAPSGRCFLYNNFVLLLPAFATATGGVTVNVGVPAAAEFHGGRLFSQLLAFEPTANATGVITSNLAILHWVAPFTNVPVGQVTLSGSLAGNGIARANAGFVVQFD